MEGEQQTRNIYTMHRVDGHYTKLPTGRRMAKVAYGWTATTLSYLQVDTWLKSPTGEWSLY